MAHTDRPTIDLNADVGESFGAWSTGADELLVPLVSSVNIACGAHAGDPVTMVRTAELAVREGVSIGAHPGYPDLAGFGRRELDLTSDELQATIVVQVGALIAATRVAGGTVRHVKPHGAMYNRAARDPEMARTIAGAVRDVDPELVLVGLAGSESLVAGRAAGLRVAAEAFADRRYEADGSLRSRRLDGAMLAPGEAAGQAVSIARDACVTAGDGSRIEVRAETICVHGDGPLAVATARAVREALEAAGFALRAVDG
jgi:UPF0271 protein